LLVMVSNNTSAMSLRLAIRNPGRIGLMMSPDGWHDPWPLPFAVDNGAYSCWKSGRPFDFGAFNAHLNKVRSWRKGYLRDYSPMFAVVPDVVGDAELTLKNWEMFTPYMKDFPLALAVQDGMTPGDIKDLSPYPDAIFIGGTLNWKLRQIESGGWNFVSGWLHAGRIFDWKHLEMCDRMGIDSVDSTGFFRAGVDPAENKKLAGLIAYLEGEKHPQENLFKEESC